MNLEEKIKFHQDNYYNNEPQISDAEFDALWNQLIEENPESELLKDIGKTTWDGFKKIEHNMMMGSQDKFNNEDDFRHWLKVKTIQFPILLQHKLDGLSIELQYVDGIFTRAITRGDGLIGDDVTNNVSHMEGVPKKINVNWTGSIRGEIVLKNSVFNEFFKDAKNPRNMASGITKRKSGADCDRLSVIVYDAQGNIDFETETDKFRFLDDEQFETVTTMFCNSAEEILKLRDDITFKREILNVAIDGIVLKQNTIVESDLSRKRPEYQRAFKFETEEVVTKLIDIEWSRNGYNYTPVAILEPVNLMGSTIKRASLANLDNIAKLNVHIGDDVLIHKAGEIIPQILKVVKSGDLQGASLPPIVCEVCDGPLEITGTRVYCPNLDCGGRKFHRLEKWIAKTGVKGFGPALLNYLFRNEFVRNIQDFYTLDMAEVLAGTNLVKSLEKAFTNLYKVNELPLEAFVSGFDIEGIGEGVVKFAVEAGYDTLEKLNTAFVNDFVNIEGFSDGRAISLFNAMADLYDEMTSLTSFVSIKEIKEEIIGSLNKASFCFTGKLEQMKRTEAQKMVIDNGGTVSNGVSKDLNYLVTNQPNSGSAKNKKAQSFGTKLITEVEFMEMVK